jgi:NADPH2:quinone reductase
MSHPSTIHAIAIEETGDFDVIRKLELPFPKQEPGHVLIKVEYGGVNMIDTYFRCVPLQYVFVPRVTWAALRSERVCIPSSPSRRFSARRLLAPS